MINNLEKLDFAIDSIQRINCNPALSKKLIPKIVKILNLKKRITNISDEIGLSSGCSNELKTNQCQSNCCNLSVLKRIGELEFLVSFYGLTEDIRAKAKFLLQKKQDKKCSFLQEEGCLLEKENKPFHCLTYYCHSNFVPDFFKQIVEIERQNYLQLCQEIETVLDFNA